MSALPRFARCVAIAVLVTCTSLVVVANTASAVSVTTEAQLRTQFADLTATSITLANDITLSDCDASAGDLFRPASAASLTLDGAGFSITQTCAGQRVMETDGLGLTLHDVTITGGRGTGQGGGVYSSTTGPLTLDHATVTGNRVDSTTGGLGGGIMSGGDLTLISSAVTNNHSGGGTSIFSGLGGGLAAGGTVMATDSTISGNVSEGGETSGGDAAAAFGNSPQTYIRSTISGNRSEAGTTKGSGYSAGIAINSPLTLVNSTVTGNVAVGPDSYGAGVGAGEKITLVYSTISGNSAAHSANVAFHGPDGTDVAFGSVVSNPLGGGENCGNLVFESQGANYSDDASCGFTNVAGGDRESAADPMLGALAANGGATQTLLPLAGSPLLDAVGMGACQTGDAAGVNTDQRGITRPQGTGCDIGAVEIEVAVTEPTTTTVTTNPSGATTVPGTTTVPGASTPATPVSAQPTYTG